MVERSDAEGEAPPYVVANLKRDPNARPGHDHVMEIETRDPDGVTTRWPVIEVIDAVGSGERFVVEGDGSGPDSALEPAVCPVCRRVTVTVSDGAPVS